MTDELALFRAELKAAGEPWQQRGVKVCAAGFVALVFAQLSAHLIDRLSAVLAIFVMAVALLAIGWVFLIVAFVRRRRWAKARADLAAPDLPHAP
jgi:hypothetical protein